MTAIAKATIVSALLVLLLETGCTYTRMTGFGGDLTRKDIEPQGLAIGGVTAMGGGEPIFADDVARKVEEQFRSARPWLRMVPLDQVRKRFDPTEYHQALKQISEGADWAPADLAVFDRLTNDTRYVLLVNIRAAGEHQGSYSSPGTLAYITAVIFHTFDSSTDHDQTSYGTLKTEIVFGIFDLDSHTMVWIASAETKLRKKGATVHVIESPPGTATTPVPPAPIPSLIEALDRVGPKIVQRLPK
jgi:hypothetical protein